MPSEQERKLKDTLLHLIELFQTSKDQLSVETQAGIVQALEGFRWDSRRFLPKSSIWEELEAALRQLDTPDKRRFEGFVREMLLGRIA